MPTRQDQEHVQPGSNMVPPLSTPPGRGGRAGKAVPPTLSPPRRQPCGRCRPHHPRRTGNGTGASRKSSSQGRLQHRTPSSRGQSGHGATPPEPVEHPPVEDDRNTGQPPVEGDQDVEQPKAGAPHDKHGVHQQDACVNNASGQDQE